MTLVFVLLISTFPVSKNQTNGAIITVTTFTGELSTNGLCSLTDGVTIDGGGNVIINGAGFYRALYINEVMSLTLMNVSITNTYHSQEGGSIYNAGDLFVLNSTFYNNVTDLQCGAIYQNGVVGSSFYIENSTFDKNFAGLLGGVLTIAGGEGQILSASFLNTKTDLSNGDGGAIYVTGGNLLRAVNNPYKKQPHVLNMGLFFIGLLYQFN